MNHPVTSKPSPRRAQRIPYLNWILLGILIGSVGVVFAIAEPQQAAAFGLQALASSSPISPMPTPAPAEIHSIDPSQGINTAVVNVNIYGRNYAADGKVYLRYSKDQSAPSAGSTERPIIPLRSEYINSQHILAKIPATVNQEALKPGYYDIGIQFPKSTPFLSKAYRIFAPDDLDDLYAAPYHLASVPSTLYAGAPAQFALKVHRLGGQGGTGPFSVEFFVNSVEPAHSIGTGVVTGISPGGFASSSLVEWTPTERGEVKIIAVIDSGNDVVESNEDNNMVTAIRHVRQKLTDDIYPPTVEDLRVNGGVKEVNQRDTALQATLVDGPDPRNPAAFVSGASRIYYAELHWYAGVGEGSGSWIPVKWTQWLPYSDKTPDAFTLHPTPGLRFLQAWGVDAAGNISTLPATQRLTYIPSQDEISMGEIRVYRREVQTGQCLTAQIQPLGATDDPDLYIWAPSGALAGASILGAGQTDRVSVFPTDADVYQIEVEGYTDATYSIAIEVTDSCTVSERGEARQASAKTPRSTPAIAVTEEATATDAPAPQSQIVQFLAFLSVTVNNVRSVVNEIYLPSIQAFR